MTVLTRPVRVRAPNQSFSAHAVFVTVGTIAGLNPEGCSTRVRTGALEIYQVVSETFTVMFLFISIQVVNGVWSEGTRVCMVWAGTDKVRVYVLKNLGYTRRWLRSKFKTHNGSYKYMRYIRGWSSTYTVDNFCSQRGYLKPHTPAHAVRELEIVKAENS